MLTFDGKESFSPTQIKAAHRRDAERLSALVKFQASEIERLERWLSNAHLQARGRG